MEPALVQILLASSAADCNQDKYLKAGLLDKCGGELIHLISAACTAVGIVSLHLKHCKDRQRMTKGGWALRVTLKSIEMTFASSNF